MVQISKTDNRLEVVRSAGSVFTGVISVLWLIPWTSALVCFTWYVFFRDTGYRGGGAGLLLMAAICLLMVAVAFWNLFGKEILIIADGQLILHKKALFTITKHRIPVHTITNVDVVFASVEKGGRKSYRLKISTANRSFSLGKGEPTAELHTLQGHIREFIRTTSIDTLPPETI